MINKKDINFNILSNNSNFMDNIYDNYLNAIIKNIKAYPCKSGLEGSAYFINDKFVVKCFKNLEDNILINFNNYCKEISEFAEKGYLVPKIYAWKTLTNGKDNESYILEERVPGRAFYEYDYFDLSYELFKDICSEQEFKNAIKTKNSLYYNLLTKYIKNIIKENEIIIGLSDSEIEKFIESDFKMRCEGKYSSVDLHNYNLLTDGNRLTIIDNFFINNETINDISTSRIQTIENVLMLFDSNSDLTRIVESEVDNNKKSFIKLNNLNRKICSESVKRFIKKLELILLDIKLEKTNALMIYSDLINMLDTKSAKDVSAYLGLN